MTGTMPCASMASISAMVCGRTPDAPRPSEASFSAMIKAHDFRRQRLADAAAMRQDQIALQRLGVVGGNT